MLACPRLLVLDEPTNGLDPIGIEELRDLIRAFAAEGITVLVSSHILSEVQQMADRIGIIYRGRLAYEDELREGCDLEALFMDVCRRGAASGRAGGMTGIAAAKRPSRASARQGRGAKFKHAAPMRLAIVLALPMPLLGAWPSASTGEQVFSAWNYWYALFLPVMLALVTACVANVDARLKLRPCSARAFRSPARGGRRRGGALRPRQPRRLRRLLRRLVGALDEPQPSSSSPASSAFSAQGATLAGAATMLACALVNVVTSAWMIPAGLFLASRFGMLAGIFAPLAVQIAGGFAWAIVPLPQLFPPSASMVIPTSFIPVLPSGEPLSPDMALGGALAAGLPLTVAGLAVCAAAFVALAAAGAAWLKGAEER